MGGRGAVARGPEAWRGPAFAAGISRGPGEAVHVHESAGGMSWLHSPGAEQPAARCTREPRRVGLSEGRAAAGGQRTCSRRQPGLEATASAFVPFVPSVDGMMPTRREKASASLSPRCKC